MIPVLFWLRTKELLKPWILTDNQVKAVLCVLGDCLMIPGNYMVDGEN